MFKIDDIQYAKVKKKGRILYDKKGSQVLLDPDERVLYIKGDLNLFRDFKLDFKDYFGVVVYDENLYKYIIADYDIAESSTFWVYAYLKKEMVPIPKHDIRPLDETYYEFIRADYDMASDDELHAIIAKGELFGLFIGGDLAGYIGIHTDGTMGLLKVFAKYRRQNLAYALEGYLINHLLAKGELPYCDVETDNVASMKLQEKLGLSRSDKAQYWLFRI